MLEVLSYLKDVLEEDELIASLITEYGEEPAVAYQAAPSDMSLPYIVVNVQTNNEENNLAVERMYYTVDVYTDNGDIVTALTIAQQVDKLFNRRKLPTYIGVGIWREIMTPVTNTEDLAVQHIHLSFLVRHRSEVYEEEVINDGI